MTSAESPVNDLVGGPVDVAMIRPLPSVARCWLQHNEESRADGPDQRHERANSQGIPLKLAPNRRQQQ